MQILAFRNSKYKTDAFFYCLCRKKYKKIGHLENSRKFQNKNEIENLNQLFSISISKKTASYEKLKIFSNSVKRISTKYLPV